MVFVKSEGSPLLPGGAIAKTRSVKWTAAALLLCACVIVASVVSFKPAVDAIKDQQQMTELISASRLAADDAAIDSIADKVPQQLARAPAHPLTPCTCPQMDQSSGHSELSGVPYSASTTSLGSLDGGSTRNVNINIIRGGGGGFGGDGSAPPPKSPAQIMRDNIAANMQQVNVLQSQVAQQMARTNDQLRAQSERAAKLVKAQVRLRVLVAPDARLVTRCAGPAEEAAGHRCSRAGAAGGGSQQPSGHAIPYQPCPLPPDAPVCFQAQTKLDMQRMQAQSQLALAKLQAQAQQQATALAFKLEQQKATAAAAAAATATALKGLRDAAAAAKKQQAAALAALKAADAAAIAKVASDAAKKISDVRKAAAAASAAIAVQAAATRKVSRALKDHVTEAKGLFRSVNKAIDRVAKFKAIPGPAGPKGSPGRAGKVGPTGPAGKRGAKGSAGAPGAKGAPGKTGAPGKNGKDGLNGGRDGRPGRDGKPGLPGKDGRNGRDGRDGSNGARGAKGDKGDTGRQGAPGVAGPRGRKGDKGDTGARGPRGSEGPQGARGQAGTNGKDGVQVTQQS